MIMYVRSKSVLSFHCDEKVFKWTNVLFHLVLYNVGRGVCFILLEIRRLTQRCETCPHTPLRVYFHLFKSWFTFSWTSRTFAFELCVVTCYMWIDNNILVSGEGLVVWDELTVVWTLATSPIRSRLPRDSVVRRTLMAMTGGGDLYPEGFRTERPRDPRN